MKAGYSAPRAEAQARAIKQSLKRASVKSKDVSYVECHATATKVGDAIEMRGLRMALGSDANPRVGSVKGNIGHANCAAGLTGFIKTVLCLHHRTLVPTVHFQELNPRIKHKFEVQTKTETWQGERRFAGVSSFGVGGTNVHVTLACRESVVLEEGKQREEDAVTHLLPLSAKTEESLQRMCGNLARYLRLQDKNLKLSDVARTLQFGREHMKVRVCVTASTIEEAARKFESHASKSRHVIMRSSSSVVFLFPGQGTQFPGMGRAMYVVVFFSRFLTPKQHSNPQVRNIQHIQIDTRSMLRGCRQTTLGGKDLTERNHLSREHQQRAPYFTTCTLLCGVRICNDAYARIKYRTVRTLWTQYW